MSSTLSEAYNRLLQRYGRQGWWPADSPLEVMVGAVLVQNTAWRNVERAIENLREAGLLDARRLAKLHAAELAELIRPAGYYRLKAARLQNLMRLLVERYDASLERMFDADPHLLRDELLAVKGIGRETADAILLYAANQPFFVVDAYTHRVLARHGWIDFEADYDALQSHCTSELPNDVAVYNEMHALLVEVGKTHCTKKQPLCEGCPLEDMLPSSGVQEPW
ncbi:MAG: endonuclease III domain-containing protein [Planctomycetales bacterium]|nr:endonuclease III domain-containing protein [Planctomycetales bacterium]